MIDFLVAAIERDDCHIICPGNDVTRDIDNERMARATDHLIDNRPALSRWHPDFQQAFERFMST